MPPALSNTSAIIYVFSLIYKLSVKSTCYIWYPIIYIINDSFNNKISTKANLEIIKHSSLARITRFVSWLVVGVFAWKMLVLPSIVEFWNSTSIAGVINIFITPNELYIWQIVSAGNSILNLACFYYFFDRAPILIKDGILTEETLAIRLRAFKFIRGMLSLYTISVMLYLTITAAKLLAMPRLSSQLWPT